MFFPSFLLIPPMFLCIILVLLWLKFYPSGHRMPLPLPQTHQTFFFPHRFWCRSENVKRFDTFKPSIDPNGFLFFSFLSLFTAFYVSDTYVSCFIYMRWLFLIRACIIPRNQTTSIIYHNNFKWKWIKKIVYLFGIFVVTCIYYSTIKWFCIYLHNLTVWI